MRQKLCKRLEELEKISQQRLSAPERIRADLRVLDELRAKVEAWHAVPENQRWVAEQHPEFLGIRMRELRAQLAELAYGRSRAVQGRGL